MKATKMTKLGLVLGMAIFTQAAQAVTISTVASSNNLSIGELFQVDLVVSGLHDLGPFPNNEIISAFDLGIGFDNSVIQANSITIAGLVTAFGDSFLGDGAVDSIRSSELNFDYTNGTPGETYMGQAFSQAVRLSEASFLTSGALQAGQPDSFILGSIGFQAVGVGNSDLSIIDDVLYTGSAGLFDVKGLDGVTPLITTLVADNVIVSSVPVPAAVWLFGSAILGLVGFSRRKAQAI